jgi:hypothetical protein
MKPDLKDLNSKVRFDAMLAVQEMRDDPDIKAAGFQIILLEVLRPLPVQMAYAVKARIRALPEDARSDLEWVREFFRAAGLSWVPTKDENTRASTWTLDSKHISGLAFDAAPSRDGIKAAWDAPDWVWERMAVIAEKHGLKAGRRWKNKDSPHFEG